VVAVSKGVGDNSPSVQLPQLHKDRRLSCINVWWVSAWNEEEQCSIHSEHGKNGEIQVIAIKGTCELKNSTLAVSAI
jgi:hypothetical protein